MDREALDLRQLRQFAVLAEERHFGRAARRLGIAQPSLSQQVARMEQVVGHALLTRKPRVALTPAGEELLRAGRALLAGAEAGLEAARRAGRGEGGQLVLGFGASVLLAGLSRLLRDYRDRYPHIHLRLRETPTLDQADALRAGTIDVAFARAPEMPDDVRVVAYAREKFVAALPSGHLLARHRRVALGRLQEEPFVLFPRWAHPGLHDQLMDLCLAAGFHPRIILESTESLTILTLVQAELGVALLPESLRQLRVPGVSYLQLTPRTVTSEVAICHRRNDPSPTVAALVALAGERMERRGQPAPSARSARAFARRITESRDQAGT